MTGSGFVLPNPKGGNFETSEGRNEVVLVRDVADSQNSLTAFRTFIVFQFLAP